jgi:hypothetical protein
MVGDPDTPLTVIVPLVWLLIIVFVIPSNPVAEGNVSVHEVEPLHRIIVSLPAVAVVA